LFDIVLLDAPCSGLGTLRQHPEIRWRRDPAHVEELAELQAELLRAAAGHVRPGGALVYATCALGRRENDEVVGRFLAEQPDFGVADARRHLPGAAARLVDECGFLRTYPHRHGLDGFFAARLRRRV